LVVGYWLVERPLNVCWTDVERMLYQRWMPSLIFGGNALFLHRSVRATSGHLHLSKRSPEAPVLPLGHNLGGQLAVQLQLHLHTLHHL
jgi:hypothetical protein